MDVLPGDKKMAVALYECCYSCLERARMELGIDNIDEADRWIKEFRRCKRDLDKLIQRKKEYDRLTDLVHEMQKKGVDITILEKEKRPVRQH